MLHDVVVQVARAEGLTKTTSVTKGGLSGDGVHCTNAPSSMSIWQVLLPHTSGPGEGNCPVTEQLDGELVDEAGLEFVIAPAVDPDAVKGELAKPEPEPEATLMGTPEPEVDIGRVVVVNEVNTV